MACIYTKQFSAFHFGKENIVQARDIIKAFLSKFKVFTTDDQILQKKAKDFVSEWDFI